jgi:hypothetical protein
MRSRRLAVRHLLPVTAISVFVASTAAAQSPNCHGEGDYTGDLSGRMTLGVSSNPSTMGQYFIGISGVMIGGEDFRDGEVGWYTSVAGVTITLGELDGDGRFSTPPRESEWGHVITLEGVAGDCVITGTWTLDYDETHASCSGQDCNTRSGSFEVRATDGGAPMDTGGSLCGTMGAANAALFMATAVGWSRRRVRRRR